MVRPALAIGVLLLGLSVIPGVASACTVCSLGDDTPTSFGMGIPRSQQLRLGLEGQLRNAGYGRGGVDRLDISEQWVFLRGAWSFSDSAWVTLQVPLLRRSIRFPNLAEDIAFGVADTEVGGRWVVFRDRRFEPRHVFALRAGVELPTGLLRTDDAGAPLIIDQQLGSGGIDGRVGVDYAWLGQPVSVFGSVTGQVSSPGFLGTRVGPVGLASVSAQVRWVPELATRIGVQCRYDAPLRFDDGTTDQDSGGFVAAVNPALVWQPSSGWFFSAGVEWPVIRALRGDQFIGATPYLEVVVDV